MAHLILLRGAPGAGKTTAARTFAAQFARWQVVEVDDVKLERHGTAETCVPAQDFPEAGRRARKALEGGMNVVGVEFFNPPDLIDLFLGPTGLTACSQGVIAFWLECDVEVAVVRKRGEVPEQSVRDMHAFAPTRFAIPGESVIDTTATTVDQVVRQIAAGVLRRGVPLVATNGA